MSFTISKLAQLTGFSPLLLRAWERRHGILQPERLDSGHRRYTPQDLAVLQSVRVLLDEGHKIGDIARQGREQLALRDSARSSALASDAPPVVPPSDDYLDGRHPDIAWSILEALPLAVIVTDKRGLVRWINRGVAVLCGYDLAELHGLSPGRILQGPGSDQRAAAELRTAIVSRRPGSVKIVNYHKSGEPYLAQVDVAPLGFGIHHVGFVGTARRLE
ncbi:MAG TPA: MerR family transcriptional regulator [Polyangiaceae bacterium]|nr:MerR family transcriptional regulator [Polyangiaceae bacterium]